MWPSWEQTLLVFGAAVLEGAVGFDFGLVATPALGSLLGVRQAVLLLSLPNLSLMAVRMAGGGVPAAPLRRIMGFIGAGGLGTAVGVAALISSPPVVLKWAAGILVLLWVGYSLSRFRVQFDLRDETFFAYIAGFLAGGLTGFSHAGGTMVFMYLDSLGLSRIRLVKLMSLCALVFATVQVAALGGTASLTPPEAMRSAIAILPALAGYLLGRVLRGRFSPSLGYAAGLGIMAAAAASLLAFGPSGWE